MTNVKVIGQYCTVHLYCKFSHPGPKLAQKKPGIQRCKTFLVEELMLNMIGNISV